jgi:hypothetical protein
MRVSLSRAEVKVLLQHYNSLADRQIRTQVRLEHGQRYELNVRSFIRKLLIAGIKDGCVTVPTCFSGNPVFRKAAEQARKNRMH